MKIRYLLLACLLNLDLKPTTLVYNLRIRRTFSLGEQFAQLKRSRLLGSAVPIYYQRDRHIVDNILGVAVDTKEERKVGGLIANLRYVSQSNWWFEATTGFEKEWAKYRGSINFDTSRGGVDDFVIAGGYNMYPAKNIQFVLYTIAGFPTRRDVTIQERFDPLVGTRFFAAGLGAEFSYSFINKLKRSFIALLQTRFLHIFDRNWEPILPANSRIIPGNVTDLLLILQWREKKDIFEAGYNPTFFTNQAIEVNLQKIKSDTFLRNSFYLSYSRLFKETWALRRPGLIGAGINISRTNRFSAKTFIAWLNFTVVF